MVGFQVTKEKMNEPFKKNHVIYANQEWITDYFQGFKVFMKNEL